MDDLISRQAAIDALLEEVRLVDGYYVENDEVIDKDDAIEAIRLLSSAQPEIIRCKDCKNIWYSGTATIKGVSTKIYKCDWWDNRVVSEKGFCFMAERKTDD